MGFGRTISKANPPPDTLFRPVGFGRRCFVQILAVVSRTRRSSSSRNAILFTIEAWDVNCSQHITERYTQAEVALAVAGMRDRIAFLEDELRRVQATAATS